MMDQCLITSKDFTQRSCSHALHNIARSCWNTTFLLFVLSVNTRGTDMSCNASTMTRCIVLKNDQGHMPHAAMLHIFPSVRAISSTRSVLTPVIQALRRPLRLTFVTLSLPDAKMLDLLSTRCLDATSVPYTTESCRGISTDDTFCTRTKRVTPTSKRDEFSKVGHRVEQPQLCPFCPCASNNVTVNTRILRHTCIYQLYFKFWRVLCLW